MTHISLRLLIFLGAAPALYALDLTPSEASRDLEGEKVPVTLFKDGPYTVTWQAPWAITGGGKRISLLPPTPQSSVSLEVRSMKESEIPPDSAPAPEILEKWAAPFLRQDATEIVPIKTIRGSYQLNSQPSKEYIFSYLSQSRRFTTSASFVDLNDKERVFVVITAPSSVFEPIHAEAVSSLFRMEWSR